MINRQIIEGTKYSAKTYKMHLNRSCFNSLLAMIIFESKIKKLSSFNGRTLEYESRYSGSTPLESTNRD